MKALACAVGIGLVAVSCVATASEAIRLANSPALSPDGKTLVFSWRGDVWSVASAGGVARPLTMHSGSDQQPRFSPDGAQIAFVGDRGQGQQVYVMPAEGGAPKALTGHTGGYSLEGWYPDGLSLLVRAQRDHFWARPDRFFRIKVDNRSAEELLFDDYGANGSLSPDGRKLLFTREGPSWWRKGYYGSQASQIWMYDLDAKKCTKLLAHERGCTWPLWKPDGSGFYYVSGRSGSFNLWEKDVDSLDERQLTEFDDDSVVYPCISRDGSTIVFRHLFDFYRLEPRRTDPPKRIDIQNTGDLVTDPIQRLALQQATDVAFSKDGLEIAFVSGGDLWVMDTELREPRQVTSTPEEERDPVFSPEGDSILFVSDTQDQTDIWRAKRGDTDRYWWQNQTFPLERLTHDDARETDLKWSPDGKRVAFVRGAGDLWTISSDGKEPQRVLHTWDRPQYDWSPDSKWFVAAYSDHDYNRDVWIFKADGTGQPFNVSRHPHNDGEPVWSPDGKMIAYTGQRAGAEVDIYYVWLQEQDHETGSRERTMEKAQKKLDAVRKSKSRFRPAAAEPANQPDEPDEPAEPAAGRERPNEPETPLDALARSAARREGDKPVEVKIDFEGLPERVRRISIPESSEFNLFWSHDSKRLAFGARINDERGTYSVEIPDSLTPRQLTSSTGSHARWLRTGDQIVWLVDGVPASFSAGRSGGSGSGGSSRGGDGAPAGFASRFLGSSSGSSGGMTTYRFTALQVVDRAARQRAAFDLAWKTMRDHYYDERLGNRNWDAIRRKYSDAAAASPDTTAFATVVNLMLGELNGSHLGFSPISESSQGGPPRGPRRGAPDPGSPFAAAVERTWRETTAHLGVRFEPGYPGPGLKIRDVIPDSPADLQKSRLYAGEVILSIDGKPVDPSLDLSTVLNGPPARDVLLKVRDVEGAERDVVLRPISYSAANELLYEKWVKDNRRAVNAASKDKLAYLHIRGMNTTSFERFEAELYSVAAGKEGIVIDVRENGGGSTTDHLLTVLCQPTHAITVSRESGPGYPQDRRVYATWDKPVVVLCNQNSFSNAEIFSHAIKTLGRGKLVGVPTAGGVISTGGTSIMGMGFLRLPTRGWYLLKTGEDMELNGAVPDEIIWPEPGQMPAGKDVQLDKAIDVLLADVDTWQQRPQPKLRKASERDTFSKAK